MGVNKVELANGETLVDLTRNTVNPNVLLEGYTATNAQGEEIIGTMVAGGGDDETLKKVVEGGATEIVLPDSVTTIKRYCFYADTTLIYIRSEGVISIGNHAFYGCTSLALTSLPEGVTSIDTYTFYDCTSLALTSLPEGVTSIGAYAFNDCTSLALTSLPEGVTSIGASAFRGCTSLALTSLPEGVTSIGAYTFYGCTSLALTSLPEGVTSIGASAFRGCTSLALMSLPEGVTSIAAYAFNDCMALTTLILRRTDAITTLGNKNAFTNTPIASGTGYIYVPSALLATYQAATNWTTYSAQFRAIEDYPEITGG